MNIPEELIEQVAQILGTTKDGEPIATVRLDDLESLVGTTPGYWQKQARAALSAAAPMLMARAWDEGMNLAWDLAAETEPRPGRSWRVDWMNRMEHEVERNPYRKETP